MNKFRFIKDLLDNEKFSASQKERFLNLVLKEFDEFGERDEKVARDVELIKEKLGLSIIGSSNNSFGLGGIEEERIRDINKLIRLADSGLANEMIEKTNENPKIGGEIRNDILESFKKSAGIKVVSPDDVGNIEEILGSFKESMGIKPELNKIELKDSEKDLVSNENNTSDDEVLPKYFFPSSLYKFLFAYNQNKILKSTCHDIDSDELEIIKEYCGTTAYNFDRHLEKILEAFKIHEKKWAPTYIKALIRGYLTGENYDKEAIEGWASENITINWSSEELKNWAKKNAGVPPNPSDGLIDELENTGYEFTQFQSKLTGNNIQSFSQLVIHFKHLFHIRGDNSLRAIIERKNQIENWDVCIDFIIEDDYFPNNIEHFTDIDKLVQAYQRIIKLIIEVEKKYNLETPLVKLSASVDLNSFQFSIHHLNTQYKKSKFNIEERLGQSYRNLITYQINGLCEFYLRADFGNGECAEVNIWNGKPRESKAILEKDFKGVEHVFKFPKK